MLKYASVSLAFLIVVILAFPSFAQDDDEREAVAATQLLDDYLANELAADHKYQGKNFLIQGVVDRIAKDIQGKPYITLAGKDPIRRIQVQFPEDRMEALIKLNKGDTVQLLGRVDGLMANVMVTFIPRPE